MIYVECYVSQCGYNTDLVHYFSLRNFSGFAHDGEVKSLPQRVPSATAAFLLQPRKPLSLPSTAQVDRLCPPSFRSPPLPILITVEVVASRPPPPQRLLVLPYCHLAGTATHALAPSAFITFAHICLLDIHRLPVCRVLVSGG